MFEVWWPMKQRAHIDISSVVGSEMSQLQDKNKRGRWRNKRGKKLPGELGVAKTTPAQTKPSKKGVFHLVGLNSKCTIIAVNFKMAVFVHISRVKMAANPKIIFFCVYIHLCQCHPYKGQQRSIRTHPSFLLACNLYGKWNDWEHRCSSVQLEHNARAMQHTKLVDEI